MIYPSLQGLSTWKQVHSMLAGEYRQAKVTHHNTCAPGRDLIDASVYKTAYDRIMESYSKIGVRYEFRQGT